MNIAQAMDAPLPVKLTLDDFELLHKSGGLDGYAKTELIEGAIFTMNEQYRRHSFAKNELTFRMRLALQAMGSNLLPQSEATVAMPPNSAPKPDIVVTSAPKGDKYVPLESVALIVEIADSSVAFDLREKAALYAAHGVPEYWVLEIAAASVRQMWSPAALGYEDSRSVEIGGMIESVTIHGLAVETKGLI